MVDRDAVLEIIRRYLQSDDRIPIIAEIVSLPCVEKASVKGLGYGN